MTHKPLTTSYSPADRGEPVLETTVGGVLRDQAALTPDAIALIQADMAGVLRRRWTYAEAAPGFLAPRPRPGFALCAGRTALRLGAEHLRMGAGGICRGPGGPDPVTANPAYKPRELKFVLEQSRAVGLFLIGEYRGNPMAEIAAEVVAGLPALREVVDMEDAPTLLRHRSELAAIARSLARRSGPGAIHLRHYRFSQGCAAASSRPDQ